MSKYIDAHCHIGNGTTDDRVTAFICNSVDEPDWNKVLRTAMENPTVVPCVGIHPWHAGATSQGWDTRLRGMLLQYPRCMVGEIGLDKLHPNYNAQIDVFMRQIQIAIDMHRAVHVHCVHAWGDMMDILARMPGLPPVIVFHACTASSEIMQRLLKLNTRVYFSYSDAICDTRRKNLIKSVRDTSPENILIESDDVMSLSGDILPCVAQQIATIKNMAIESLLDTIYTNAQMVIQNG